VIGDDVLNKLNSGTSTPTSTPTGIRLDIETGKEDWGNFKNRWNYCVESEHENINHGELLSVIIDMQKFIDELESKLRGMEKGIDKLNEVVVEQMQKR